MFFGSLIGTYLAYKGKSISGPARTTCSTSRSPPTARPCCSRSSLTMVLALAALQDEPGQGGGAAGCFATAAAGAALRAEPGLRVLRPSSTHHDLTGSRRASSARPSSSSPASTAPTSPAACSGYHPAGRSLAWRGRLDRRDYTKVEIAGLYWHFVGHRVDRDLHHHLPHPLGARDMADRTRCRCRDAAEEERARHRQDVHPTSRSRWPSSPAIEVATPLHPGHPELGSGDQPARDVRGQVLPGGRLLHASPLRPAASCARSSSGR